MTKSVTTMIAVLAVAAGLSAQKKIDTSVTGTWNMGLQGGHVIPVALVLKQDGTTLSGTVVLPTQHTGQTVDVSLTGEIANGAFTVSGTSRARRNRRESRSRRTCGRRQRWAATSTWARPASARSSRFAIT
jgi:hypothetical protein